MGSWLDKYIVVVMPQHDWVKTNHKIAKGQGHGAMCACQGCKALLGRQQNRGIRDGKKRRDWEEGK